MKWKRFKKYLTNISHFLTPPNVPKQYAVIFFLFSVIVSISFIVLAHFGNIPILNEMSCWYLITSVVISTLYGIFAFGIFNEPKRYKISWYVHQFWFNFLGSLIGWLSLWILFKHLQCMPTYEIASNLKLADFVLILTAFIGITGHLPKTVMGFILGIGKLADRLLSGK